MAIPGQYCKFITDAVYDDAYSFSNGMAPVAKQEKYGYIDTTGSLVIPLNFNNARSFSEGLAPASNQKGFWGYIDLKGNWIIKPVYDFADSFENGKARVMKASTVSYIDKSSNTVNE
jgi:hypothetical protein